MLKLNMKPHKTNGTLITFCGLDGCGKSSMIERLKSALEHTNEVFLTKQPTDFVRKSDIFRTYMDSPDHDEYDYRSLSLLAASDRVQHVNKVIYPKLKEGKAVISDRYFYSCLANLRARGYTEDKWIYEIAESVVKPDFAFFLDVPASIAIERVRSRPEEADRYIDIKFQHKLREEYLRICEENNGILISTDCDPQITYSRIMEKIMYEM